MQVQPSILRKLNERRVLNAFRTGKTVSRTDIQRSLKLTMPTVSKILDELVERGWVTEVGVGESRLGRPPRILEINPRPTVAIGIHLGLLYVRIVCVNLLGEVLHECEMPADEVRDTEQLLAYIEQALTRFNVPMDGLMGIGLAAPGSRNPHPALPQRAREIDQHPNHHWHHLGLESAAVARFGVPVWMDNDANAAALGEMWFGAGRNANHLIFVFSDEGLGAGIGINGSIYRGENNVAGEFSHMIVDVNGESECACGRRGCMANIGHVAALRSALANAGLPPRPLSETLMRAEAGIEPEQSVVSTTFDYLAIAITNLVDVIDPGILVLGGSLFEASSYAVEEVARRVRDTFLPKQLPVACTEFGRNAVALGAATLVLQDMYDHTKLLDPVDSHSESAVLR